MTSCSEPQSWPEAVSACGAGDLAFVESFFLFFAPLGRPLLRTAKYQKSAQCITGCGDLHSAGFCFSLGLSASLVSELLVSRIPSFRV